MSDTLIKAENVSKKYCRGLKRSLWYGLHDLGSELLGRPHGGDGELRLDEFWAVRNISFELKRGECLGFIGHNGAGKSTLLKMLNGIIKPDHGRITLRGRICGLIELGGGFNPVLTGRENIYINGSVLGFTKLEIDQKIEAIIDFAELEEFIDMPIKNYSSGMKVRLGFSVMAQMDPDVLIIDEVLAVGDVGFVLKCLNWIDNLLENTAVIFVSHSMPMVSRICTNIILLDHSEVQYQSKDIGAGIARYLEKLNSDKPKVTFVRDDKIELLEVAVDGCDRVGDVYTINRLDDMVVRFVFYVDKEINSPSVSLFFLDQEQRPIAVCSSHELIETGKHQVIDGRIRHEVCLVMRKIQFSSGRYNVTFGLSEKENSKPLIRVRNAIQFNVIGDRHVWQPFELEGEWSKKLPG